MSAYDDCAFDRCSIGDTDYDKAQVLHACRMLHVA